MAEIDLLSQMFMKFHLHDGCYGLPLENVVEVVRMVAITREPKSPVWLAGVINVRGRIIPVVDLRLRLGLPAAPTGLSTPILLVQHRQRVVGLIVDQTDDVVVLPPSALEPPDELTLKARPVQAVGRVENQILLILNLARLIAGAEKFNRDENLKVKDEEQLQQP